jgi:hypothetical protein
MLRNVENLQHFVKIIKALKQVGSGISYTYNEYEIYFNYMSGGRTDNIEDFQYVLDDIEQNGVPTISFRCMLEILIDDIGYVDDLPTRLILEYAFRHINIDFMEEEYFDHIVPIYLVTQNNTLLGLILKNMHDIHIDNQLMDIIVKNIDRENFMSFCNLIKEKRARVVLQKYDDAVCRKIVEISAGFGYQGIPNLILDAIIGEVVDTSGMTAYKIDKIISKFNIWKTDTTMRLGKQEYYQSEFQDA